MVRVGTYIILKTDGKVTSYSIRFSLIKIGGAFDKNGRNVHPNHAHKLVKAASPSDLSKGLTTALTELGMSRVNG